MDTPSPSMRELARRLLAVEAESQPESGPHSHPAVRVCEKLRISLTKFAGADGFASLMRRAMALARAEVPSVNGITIKPDCSMEGLREIAADARKSGASGDEVAEAVAAITAHLLGLLVIFIGEPFTLRLVREAWPDTPLDEWQSRTEAD